MQAADFPMINNADNKYASLRLIDIPEEIAQHVPWFNQTLTVVNNAVVRIGIFEGEFPWHKHSDEDEFFLVLDGEIFLDVDKRPCGCAGIKATPCQEIHYTVRDRRNARPC